MKKSFLIHRFPFSSIRSAAAGFLLLIAGLLFGSTLLAGKTAEPGPEADGVYSCGKTIKGKYVDLGKLEIKGKTFATYSKGDPKENRRFDSFTADASGRIVRRVGLNFLSWSAHMAGGTSPYSVDEKGKPSILINYSDDHNPT